MLSRKFVPKISVSFFGLKGQVPVKLLNLNGRLTTESNNSVVGTYQNWQWWVLCLLSASRSSFCATGLYQIPNAHHGFRVGPGVITANSKTSTNPRKSVNSNILETGRRFWIEVSARQCIYIFLQTSAAFRIWMFAFQVINMSLPKQNPPMTQPRLESGGARG